MKLACLIVSVLLFFFISFFLHKYDGWGISRGLCLYNDSSVAAALSFIFVLFVINFSILVFGKKPKPISSLVFVCISLVLTIYWHPLIYINLIKFLINYTQIQIEQIGSAAMCELQRYHDAQALGLDF